MNSKKPDQLIHIEIVKNFTATPDKVFEAWLDPEMLSRWMFGQEVRDEEIISLKNEPINGGTFSYSVRRDGQVLDHRGTYRIVERPKRLVFTWGEDTEAGDESVVSIDFESTQEGCRLTLIHRMGPKWKEYKKRTKEGWSFMLDKLKEIL